VRWQAERDAGFKLNPAAEPAKGGVAPRLPLHFMLYIVLKISLF